MNGDHRLQRALRRLLPAPLLSALLLAAWLILNQSLSVGQLLLGAALALALPGFTSALRSTPPHVRSWRRVARLASRVLLDIVRANLHVVVLLMTRPRALRPAFVVVPLDLRDPHAIVILACIVTLTPSTLSADLDDSRRELLVHGLDVDDPAALIAEIKARYETPLREIFE